MATRVFHTYVVLMVVVCGFQFKDEDIKVGVTYKVQYLGSVEVAFDQTDQAANQKASETAVSAVGFTFLYYLKVYLKVLDAPSVLLRRRTRNYHSY